MSLHVPKGKMYGLLGRNGAVKTTVIRMMLNLIRPTAGTILLFGKDYRENSDLLARKQLIPASLRHNEDLGL